MSKFIRTQNFAFQNKKAFTLIELVLSIIIIGVLFSIVSVSLSEIRRGGRDTRRVSDIKKIQLVLESYYRYEEEYPDEIIFGQSLLGKKTGKVYMLMVPKNPLPASDNCEEKEYIYQNITEESFALNFCLESNINDFSAGINCLNQLGIVNCQ